MKRRGFLGTLAASLGLGFLVKVPKLPVAPPVLASPTSQYDSSFLDITEELKRAYPADYFRAIVNEETPFRRALRRR